MFLSIFLLENGMNNAFSFCNSLNCLFWGGFVAYRNELLVYVSRRS